MAWTLCTFSPVNLMKSSSNNSAPYPTKRVFTSVAIQNVWKSSQLRIPGVWTVTATVPLTPLYTTEFWLSLSPKAICSKNETSKCIMQFTCVKINNSQYVCRQLITTGLKVNWGCGYLNVINDDCPMSISDPYWRK